MKAISKTWKMFTAAMVLAAAAALMIPAMAFAATNVEVNYQDVFGDAKSAVVDLDALPADTQAYNYMFQKAGVNNVLKADKSVTVDAVVNAALTANGDEGDLSVIWASGKKLTFTADGVPYTKYRDFSYDRLMAANFFFKDTLATGMPIGVGTDAPAVFALQSGSQKMDVTSTQTADEVAGLLATSTKTSPRLLWGWPSATPGSDQLGGNRYPSNIDSITIS